MPNVSPTEDKFAGLIAVFDHDANYAELALKPAPEVVGSFEVDWGDGTVEEYAFDGGDLIVATHQYDFSNTNLTDTVSTLGYKQAMVVVTPIEGAWGYFSLQEDAIPGTSPYQSPVNWLDIVFSGPNVTTLKLGLED
jgi:hypothetical protein